MLSTDDPACPPEQNSMKNSILIENFTTEHFTCYHMSMDLNYTDNRQPVLLFYTHETTLLSATISNFSMTEYTTHSPPAPQWVQV